VIALVLAAAHPEVLFAADPGTAVAASAPSPKLGQRPLLTAEEWKSLDRAVDRGLDFISKSQDTDGSFPTRISGQPGVTSLCVMAMLARGHQPGQGPNGAQIEKAIDFVLDLQDPSVGSIMAERTNIESSIPGHYNHGISGIMLGEVYGMTHADRHERIRKAILKALGYSRTQQLRPKNNPDDRGGWRYVKVSQNDSDLSVTAWQLMFFRSARNAGFDVPQEWVTDALSFVHRTFDVNRRTFVYALTGTDRRTTRGIVGAGIVCLELGGEHGSETARIAGDWILQRSFSPYNDRSNVKDRYHYGAFYCSQAMFQLGGEQWRQFFPNLLHVLADSQRADGSWDPEQHRNDASFGNVYTTALSVLALATPYQMLPIYQR
jgi:hypothetical protein